MSDDHGRFIWYELMVPDVEAAKRFYGEVLGWTTQEVGGSHMTYAMFEANGAGVGGVIPLTAEFKAQGIPPNWTAYVCVDDCDAAVRKAESLGGKVMRAARDIPGIGRLAVIADPHGAVIIVMKPIPPSEARPRAPRGTVGHGGWHELYAGDAAADLAFYRELFGWKETARHDMGPMGTYHIFGNADGDLGGMMNKPPQMPAPAWQIYFEVADADAAAERVKKAGGALAMGPMDVPGGSRVAQAIDPQGAHFAIVWSKV
ncbi:MAG TPA: VOC family protein [Caulobacteraceae bacterium]|nr:VOC family protein [Caulobacteraceae bacterium]